jgi:DNA-binding response OmpR family regulator
MAPEHVPAAIPDEAVAATRSGGRAARVFTRAHLRATVRDDEYERTSRTVDVHMHRLRRKLGPQHAGSMVTVRRVGYLYLPPRPD